MIIVYQYSILLFIRKLLILLCRNDMRLEVYKFEKTRLEY